MKNVLKRKFNTSQGEMLNNGDSVAYAVERDIELFSTFNFSSQRVVSFKNLLSDYQHFPGDQTLLNVQMVATEAKNQNRKDLLSELKVLRICAGLVFGDDSLSYYLFRFDKLRNISDSELLLVAAQMAIEATKCFNELSTYGYKQANIDNIIALNNSFDEKISIASQKIIDRDVATYERTLLANKVYDEFKIICEIGKSIWSDEGDAHYNDYVFSNSSSNNDTELVEETDTGGDSNEIEGNG